MTVDTRRAVEMSDAELLARAILMGCGLIEHAIGMAGGGGGRQCDPNDQAVWNELARREDARAYLAAAHPEGKA